MKLKIIEACSSLGSLVPLRSLPTIRYEPISGRTNLDRPARPSLEEVRGRDFGGERLVLLTDVIHIWSWRCWDGGRVRRAAPALRPARLGGEYRHLGMGPDRKGSAAL